MRNTSHELAQRLDTVDGATALLNEVRRAGRGSFALMRLTEIPEVALQALAPGRSTLSLSQAAEVLELVVDRLDDDQKNATLLEEQLSPQRLVELMNAQGGYSPMLPFLVPLATVKLAILESLLSEPRLDRERPQVTAQMQPLQDEAAATSAARIASKQADGASSHEAAEDEDTEAELEEARQEAESVDLGISSEEVLDAQLRRLFDWSARLTGRRREDGDRGTLRPDWEILLEWEMTGSISLASLLRLAAERMPEDCSLSYLFPKEEDRQALPEAANEVAAESFLISEVEINDLRREVLAESAASNREDGDETAQAVDNIIGNLKV